jgi:hypothetical protein
MSQTRFSPNLIAGIILTLLIGIALYLRVYLPSLKQVGMGRVLLPLFCPVMKIGVMP